MSENKNDLTFKYIFNYSYNPTYVNGAQGGVSPRGEVVIHFYLERPPLPNSLTYEISPQGGIGKETSAEPEDLSNSIVRFVDTGVVMNYDNARVFHAWLGDKLREVEEIAKARAAFAASQEMGEA